MCMMIDRTESLGIMDRVLSGAALGRDTNTRRIFPLKILANLTGNMALWGECVIIEFRDQLVQTDVLLPPARPSFSAQLPPGAMSTPDVLQSPADDKRRIPFFPPTPTKRIRLTRLSRLIRMPTCPKRGLNATDWAIQFVEGFPLAGALTQRYNSTPAVSHAVHPCDPSSLFANKTSRWQQRARRAPVKHAHFLRADAMQQVDGGWVAPPKVMGNFPRGPDGRCNPALRFGAPQIDKLRGFDDLKDSRSNTSTDVMTPVSLGGWDHIAGTTQISRAIPRPWAFGEIDHRAAYKSPRYVRRAPHRLSLRYGVPFLKVGMDSYRAPKSTEIPRLSVATTSSLAYSPPFSFASYDYLHSDTSMTSASLLPIIARESIFPSCCASAPSAEYP